MDDAIDGRRMHCIRYSLLVPALAAAYVIALTRSTIALEKNGCTHSLHSLDVHMYFTKLKQDIGVLEQRRNLSCMACPFHTPMNQVCTGGSLAALRPANTNR